MKEIHFVDTTVRDGQLSLWALGMRTGAMLAIAEQMDRCGFESMEFFGFAGYIKMVRERKEIPPHAAPLSRRSRDRVRENTACGALADDRTRGRAWHYADPIVGSVE